jgi:hypothetical protein
LPWCVLISAICLASVLGSVLAIRPFQALQLAAAEARQGVAAEAMVAREYLAGKQALALGDRAGAARHFKEVNLWSARVDGHLRARTQALSYWW